MYLYLREHPELFMPSVKEPHFFAKDLIYDAKFNYPDLRAYEELFSPAPATAMAGEASPFYLYSEEAISGLYEYNPGAKLLIMLRHPVAFMHSLHGVYLASGWESITDLEDALEAGEARARGGLIPNNFPQNPFILQYLKLAQFSVWVERYLVKFGSERIKVVTLEEFSAQPLDTFSSVLRFLGVDDRFAPTFGKVNARRKRRIPQIEALSNLARSELGQRMKARFPRQYARAQAIWSGVSRVAVSTPTIEESTRAKLLAHVEEDILRLTSMVDAGWNHWLRAQ